MSQLVSSKLSNIKESIFSTMTRLSDAHSAINLSQGFPEFNCSPKLLEHMERALRAGHNQYAPMPGIMALREAIAQMVEQRHGKAYDPASEITIAAGATQALYTAISAFVHEDDEVVVFEPAYDSYVPAIRMQGGRPVFVQLQHPDYRIDWNAVNKVVNSRTRMIILNSPHNPTGAVLTEEDLRKLSKLLRGSRILVLSDEVYENILFDNRTHQSVSRFPDLAERSIVISSFGKTYHTTGWKVGYVMAPAELTKEYRRIHQFVAFAVNTPAQHAFAAILSDKDSYLQLRHFYQAKRDLFVKLLAQTRFRVQPAQGTYFQLLDYSPITDESDTDFANRVVKEFGVASVPISVFYHQRLDHKVLRFCFAKEDSTLERAVERLAKI